MACAISPKLANLPNRSAGANGLGTPRRADLAYFVQRGILFDADPADSSGCILIVPTAVKPMRRHDNYLNPYNLLWISFKRLHRIQTFCVKMALFPTICQEKSVPMIEGN